MSTVFHIDKNFKVDFRFCYGDDLVVYINDKKTNYFIKTYNKFSKESFEYVLFKNYGGYKRYYGEQYGQSEVMSIFTNEDYSEKSMNFIDIEKFYNKIKELENV